MSGVSVAVYSRFNDFRAFLPRFRGLQWQDELNTTGSGSVQVSLDDDVLTAHPSVLDYFNIVKVVTANGAVSAFVVESIQRSPASESGRWVTLSGRGVLSVLANATVYPEYGLRRASFDERSFDYGSKMAGWYVSADWTTPVGVRQDASVRKPMPAKWPDGAAQWLWSSNPDATSAPGRNWFRGGFSLSSPARVKFYASMDDFGTVQLDGEPIIQTGRGDWPTPATYVADLAAGYHLVAGVVANLAHPDGTNSAAGFLLTAYTVDKSTGKLLKNVKRSAPTGFLCRGYGAAPGWFPASILKTLVSEGQARNCRTLPQVTLGFTDTTDSEGVAFTGRQDRAFRVGTDSCLDVMAQVIEDGIDVWMTPDLVLNAAGDRGADLSATVTLGGGGGPNVLSAEASSTAPQSSRALVRDKGGWQEVYVSGAESTYGRCESGLVLGTASSDTQAARLAQQALTEFGYPQDTVTVQITSERGPQPYVDFTVGDRIKMPGLTLNAAKHRVMSIAGAVDDDTGLVRYTIQSYPEA